MNETLIMTILGPDRPGLVEALSALLEAHGGNWEESRMARLGGQFAGVLAASLPVQSLDGFVQSLDGLRRQGVQITAHRSGDAPAAPAVEARLDLVTHDRPGIVHRVTEALTRHGVNVERLETRVASAPMSGEALFEAKAWLRAPTAAALDAARAELESLAAGLVADLEFKDPHAD